MDNSESLKQSDFFRQVETASSRITSTARCGTGSTCLT